MYRSILANSIIIPDGDFGEFKDLKGVMRVLMREMVECLKSRNEELLKGLKITGLNNPFDRSTKGDHTDELYPIDDIDVKIESFYTNSENVYKSYYLKIYSTEVRRGRHEVIKFFRVSDHTHKKGDKHETVTLTKEESRIIDDNKRLELVAANVEDIRQAIYEAVEKLNEFIEKEAMKLNNDTDKMINEISDLSKS